MSQPDRYICFTITAPANLAGDSETSDLLRDYISETLGYGLELVQAPGPLQLDSSDRLPPLRF